MPWSSMSRMLSFTCSRAGGSVCLRIVNGLHPIGVGPCSGWGGPWSSFARGTADVWVPTMPRRVDRSRCKSVNFAPRDANTCTVCKLLRTLAKAYSARKFILSFPTSSTRKTTRPQFLHKCGPFLYCDPKHSDGQWVQRNVRVPDSAR